MASSRKRSRLEYDQYSALMESGTFVSNQDWVDEDSWLMNMALLRGLTTIIKTIYTRAIHFTQKYGSITSSYLTPHQNFTNWEASVELSA